MHGYVRIRRGLSLLNIRGVKVSSEIEYVTSFEGLYWDYKFLCILQWEFLFQRVRVWPTLDKWTVRSGVERHSPRRSG